MTFIPSYPILTERLVLRPFTRGDVDAVFAYRRRPDVARYLFDPPMSRAECAEVVQQRISQVGLERDGDKIILAIQLASGGPPFGELSLILRNAADLQGEIGYILHPEHQGFGFASEAVRAIFMLGFEGAGLHRIMARCHALNERSFRLMERLGMRREAHLREHARVKGQWEEELIYALLAREWQAMRG